MTFARRSVAPELTVVPATAVPSALFALTSRMPLATSVAPVKLLPAESVSVPLPVTAPPTSVSVPTWSLKVCRSNVEAFTVIAVGTVVGKTFDAPSLRVPLLITLVGPL